MIFPWQLTTRLSGYLAGNKLRGRRRFPYVLMLEPLFRCNLSCAGCGRIREFGDFVDRTLSREECLASVMESGAPVVSITGGEPLIHPDIGGIVSDIARRHRFVYLCTNGTLLERSLRKFRPSPYLSFVVHLDGQAAIHDRNAGRDGVFEKAIAGIRAAKAKGFQVRTNTTVYSNSDLDDGQAALPDARRLRRRRRHGVAGVQLRRGRQRHLPDPRRGAQHLSQAGAATPGASATATPPSTGTSSPAGGRWTARPGATRRAIPSAGSGPAI